MTVVLSFLFLPLALEGVARLLPTPAPIRLRDGIYVTRLPLVSSVSRDFHPPRPDDPLHHDKAPGELRIFVFGESSVAGAPFGPEASGSAMLHDLLAPLLPDRRVTVVNMGVPASTLLDTWYYLLESVRFAPDIVVFYQGNNEQYVASGERRLPVTRPDLHGFWRFAVRHSRMLQVMRVFKARMSQQANVFGGNENRLLDPPPPDCAWEDGFAAWADIVMGEARRMGTRPLVLTPVRSPAAMVEFDGLFDAAGGPVEERLASFPDDYRAAVRCVLDLSCDTRDPMATLAARQIRHPRKMGAVFGGLGRFEGDRLVPDRPGMTFQDHYRWFHDTTRTLWRTAADRHGAVFTDFASALEKFSGGLMLPPSLVDEVHLTVEGNWRWSAWTTREILAMLGRDAEVAPDPWGPLPDLDPYRKASNEPRALAHLFVQFLETRSMGLIASLYVRELLAHHNGPLAREMRDALLTAMDPDAHPNAPGLAARLERIKTQLRQ